MTRIIVIVAWFVAACDVGDASKVGGGTVPDGGAKLDTGGGGADAAPIAAHVHQPANVVVAGNTSNAGQGCMAATNCHGATPGTGASTYAFAGTVYADANRTIPAPGVSVHAGTLAAISDAGGNFYAYAPPNLTLPCSADVTSSTMAGQLQTGGGNCNGGACHQQPGGTQLGIYK
jgi:hypothetical protein